MNRRHFLQATGIGTAAMALGGCRGAANSTELILACYEASRPLFRSINRAFIQQVERENGQSLRLRPTFGGSSKQAQVVADGLDASVVSLAVKPDVDHLVKKGLIDATWENRFPNFVNFANSVHKRGTVIKSYLAQMANTSACSAVCVTSTIGYRISRFRKRCCSSSTIWRLETRFAAAPCQRRAA